MDAQPLARLKPPQKMELRCLPARQVLHQPGHQVFCLKTRYEEFARVLILEISVLYELLLLEDQTF